MSAVSPGRLLLTPLDPERAPAATPLLKVLEESGFLGPPWPTGGPAAFLAGPRFTDWISFLGCSPHIRLEPPADGGAFCHIRLLGPYTEPRLCQGRHTPPPRCPTCRARLTDWRERVDHWRRQPRQPVPCPHCGTPHPPLALVWRQGAGWGRLFIAVEDIFPGEAVPVAGLLGDLAGLGGGPWRYFHVQE